MKHKINMILAFITLAILVAVQVYVINELYLLKHKEFDKNYIEEVEFAFDLFQKEKGFDPYDSILYNLNNYADAVLLKYSTIELENPEVKNDILNVVNQLMSENDIMFQYLKSYLKEKGLESDFESGYKIKQFGLILFDTKYPIQTEEESDLIENNASTFLQTITAEYNYYHITFDFYIDFTHKRQVIIREMRAILLLIFFTITIVFVVYLLTVRSLLQQKKLSELKSDFINNMTHELKTPLSTISVASSGLSLLDNQRGTKKVTDLSGIINRQIRLLNKMIDQILDISMLERAGFIVKRESFEIVSFFEELIEAFQLRYQDEKIVILFTHHTKGSRFVDLDKFQMNRVLINLLSNSVKYCKDVPNIKLHLEMNEKLLELKIEDNGIGIPKRDQHLIFSKFYRSSNAGNHNTKGLGLGLYFVKRIIDAHYGSIKLESNAERGTTFIISLPLEN